MKTMNEKMFIAISSKRSFSMCFGVKRLTYRRLRVYGWKQVLPLVSLRIYPVLTR